MNGETTPQDRVGVVEAAWVEHLGPGSGAPDTNFFEAGGNSLLAASMMGQLSTRLEGALPMRLLARNPTLGSLSEAIATWLDAAAVSDGVRDRA